MKNFTSNLLNAYNRLPIEIVKGENVHIYDRNGKKYLDFGCGIAVNNLGHCHPHLVNKLQEQITELWHCSNIFTNSEQERFARRITKLTSFDKIFFCSSGLEAVESAIKLMRKYGHETSNNKTSKHKIITLKNGFHGRSLACLSAGGNEISRKGFGPMLEGFIQIEKENIDILKETIKNNPNQICGVLLEPIQSEGGVWPLSKKYLKELRKITEENNILLCFDEVQSGYGRMGKLFHYQNLEITPDLITTAKGIGNGFPLAACLTKEKVAKFITPGSHGSTYGGNPMAMVVGNAVLDVITQEGFLKPIKELSSFFLNKLNDLKKSYPSLISEIRGEGFIFGIELNEKNISPQEFMLKCFKHSLAITQTSNKIIRILPPLITERKHLLEAIESLNAVCKEIEK